MAKTATKTRKPRGENVKLPDSIASTADVVWPGQSRGGSDSALRQQLADEISTMERGDVRHYEILGDKEQNSFINRFRSVADQVHDSYYGVQAVKQEDGVIVRLWDRRATSE